MSRLILFGLLWLGAIGLITFAAFRYFNDRQHLDHREQMHLLDWDDDD